MKLYIDTSSLLTLYHKEKDSNKMIDIFSAEDIEKIYLSELAKVEFISAIWKKIRQREIIKITGLKVIEIFESDWDKYEWIEITSNIIKDAEDMIKKHGNIGLRSLDSIQMACGLYVEDEDVRYITSDKLLKKCFIEEGLKVI